MSTIADPSDLLYKDRDFSSVVTGGNVFIIGGEFNSRSVQVLSAGSTTWTAGPDISVGEVYWSCAVGLPGSSNDGKFLVIGGGMNSRQVLEFDGVGWIRWSDMSRYFEYHACAATDRYVVVAGGNGGGRSTLIIDPETQNYVNGPSMKVAREFFALHYLDSELWAVGGEDDAYNHFASSEKSDLNTWELTDLSLNTARSRFSSALVPYEFVFSVGGKMSH